VIKTERSGTDASIYLNKKIRLIIEDQNRVLPRDGILKGFDDMNYYLEMSQGQKKGLVLAFLRSTVRRIEPVSNSQRGGPDY
jgi:hypothetical protein